MKKFFLNFVLLLVASLLIIPMASAADEWPAQALLKGSTSDKNVTSNGVNNSGIINFENTGVADAYKARLVKVGTDPLTDGVTAYNVEGWAWNDNLGWVSFYCNGTATVAGKNLGVDCGNQTYGVTLKYNESDKSFSFAGYAWNDATGYISMGRRFNHPSDGGSSYYGLALVSGGVVDEYSRVGVSPYGRKDIAPYAWSQSLSWINFAGVYADLAAIIIPIPTCSETNYVGVCPDVCVETSTNGEVCNENDGDDDISTLHVSIPPTFPVADGVAYYKITLNFKKPGNIEMTKAEIDTYNIKVFFNWKDTVKRDQVTATLGSLSDFASAKAPFTSTLGAVTYKPVFLYNNATDNDKAHEVLIGAPDPVDKNTNADDITSSATPANFKWDGNKLVLYVKSLAPTTGGNKSEVLSTGKFVENDRGRCVDGPLDAEGKCTGTPGTLEKNNLELESINWILTKPDTSPIIGKTSYTGGLALDFKPALEVSTFNTDSSDEGTMDSLVFFRNVQTKLNMQGKNNIPITDDSDIDTSSTNTKILFKLDNQSNEDFDIEYAKAGSTQYENFTTDIENTFSELRDAERWVKIIASILGSGTVKDYTKGVVIRSVIEYILPKKVTYYSNHLPRKESSIANPVAVIQGSLYGTGTTTQTGIELTGIGDNNTNIVKDTVYENVKKLVRDQVFTITDAEQEVDLSTFNCPNQSSIYCKKILVNGEEILYLKAKQVVLTQGAPINNKVLVVDGGNLYIDGNLYDQGDPKSQTNKLGLVVIRNTNDSLSEAGNIYVSKEVTNIQAFAVAWGAIFSYDGFDKTTQGENGEFVWENDETIMIDALNKQLIWQGGISSNNTIGGVDTGENYYKTGYQILPKDDDNLFIARLYDLNYFRYFRKKIDYKDGNPFDVDCEEYLTEEMIETINNPEGATGEAIAAVEGCNGIDLTDMKIDTDKAAEGASSTETNPLYIKYVPPYSKSVIFGKEKSLTF